MESKRALIVIPVYKRALAPLELFSLSHCKELFAGTPCVFVGPEGFDFQPYLEHHPDAFVKTFGARYFSSLEMYSALLVNKEFYQAFLDYEYLLIYQLDAWAFENQLEHWCSRGYDYIGAPWLGKDGTWTGVGNGGFSLRRVAACLQALTSELREDPKLYWEYMRRFVPSRLDRALRYHRKILKHLGVGADVGSFLSSFIKSGDAEDLFWGYHAVRYSPTFRVAPVEEALHFAIEAGLEKAHGIFSEKPPFGCHREWFLEMLNRYVSSKNGPASDYEALVWRLAELSGLPRGSF
jgi:hypothetical protein